MRINLSVITGILVTSAVMMLAQPVMLNAQEYNNTPVTVSKEKVKVGGKVCYSHIVLEKQTLYSISKAYNVSIEEIFKYNPTLHEVGLKKNSIILIPTAEAPKNENSHNQKNEASHKIHIRKWYEDLDMIAAEYGVSAEEIMAANKLTDKTLLPRQKLIIPVSDETLIEAAPQKKVATVHEEIVTDKSRSTQAEVVAAVESNEAEDIQDTIIASQKTINATVLLPMRNSEGKLSRNNMDFYSGLMLAVYDLGQNGINAEVNIYDILDEETPVTREDINNSDIIIGPISAADLTRLFQSSEENCAVVSPLDPRAERLVAEYNDLIQAPTPHRVQYQDLTNWIKEEMGENDKVFMFSERTAKINQSVDMMKEVMDSSGIAYIPFTYSILEGRDILEPLKEMMTAEGANRIYIASESEAFVNDVVRNLNLMLLENFEVVLYAPSKIRSFETIEVEHFHKTSMHVSLTYYINYEDQAVKDFLLKYRALYNTEPTQFAFQGYDIAHYFISLCYKYGKDWATKLEESEKAMLQSTFKCIKLGTGGYVNNGVRRITYGPKWTVEQVK